VALRLGTLLRQIGTPYRSIYSKGVMEKKIKINSTSLYLKVFYFHICDGQQVATIQLWLQTKYEVRNIYKPSYFLATD
jgi:hypothetical protein